MRRYAFSWVIIVLVLMFSLLFIIAKPTVTGYSVLDSGKSYNIPAYLSTFLVLLIVLVFVIFVILGMNVHASRTRVKEEESIRELIKNIK